MSVSKYNSEGYYDPTTHAALTNIENEEKRARFRPIVYICSPFSGDVEGNTAQCPPLLPLCGRQRVHSNRTAPCCFPSS